MNQLEELTRQLPYLDYVAIAVGAVLVLFGRKLYWLAVGGLGFLLGLILVDRYLAGQSFWVHLGLAVVAGIAGAVLTLIAQHGAIILAGCVIGASLSYAAALPWADDFASTIWWIPVLGGVLGICFAHFVFEGAVVVVSSAVGGALIVESVPLPEVYQPWAFVGLLALGILVQSRYKSLKPKE